MGVFFMEGIYEILLWDRPVGKAEVTREGLYYRFRCKCELPDNTVCRVTAGKESLGVLVPAGTGFALDSRLPVKRFGDSVPEFRLVPNKPVLDGKFIPIKPEEPFAYLERLQDAYLIRRGDEIGIYIKEAGT